MSVYVNIVASGLLTGLVYGLAALGLSVIFGVVRVVNFAHGEMMVLGMYGAVVLAQWGGVDPLLATPLIAALLFVVGYILQRGLVNAFIARPEHMQFILLLGLAIMLVNGLLMVFGPDARSTNVAYGFESFEVGPLLLDKTRVYAAAAAVMTALALFGFFRWTVVGKAI